MKLDNSVMGLYSRVFCTRGDLDPASKGSPLVPCPISYDSSLIPVRSHFSKPFSRRDLYSAISSLSWLPPIWKKSHRTELGFLVTSELDAEGFVLLPRKVQLTGPLLVAVLVWGHGSSSHLCCLVLPHISPWAVLSDSLHDCSLVQINALIRH